MAFHMSGARHIVGAEEIIVSQGNKEVLGACLGPLSSATSWSGKKDRGSWSSDSPVFRGHKTCRQLQIELLYRNNYGCYFCAFV